MTETMQAYEAYWLQFQFGENWRGMSEYKTLDEAIAAVREGLGIFPARVIMGGRLYARIDPDGNTFARYDPGIPLSELSK